MPKRPRDVKLLYANHQVLDYKNNDDDRNRMPFSQPRQSLQLSSLSNIHFVFFAPVALFLFSFSSYTLYIT